MWERHELHNDYGRKEMDWTSQVQIQDEAACISLRLGKDMDLSILPALSKIEELTELSGFGRATSQGGNLLSFFA